MKKIEKDIKLILKTEKLLYLKDNNIQFLLMVSLLTLVNYLLFGNTPFLNIMLGLSFASLFVIKQPLAKVYTINGEELIFVFFLNFLFININYTLYTIESSSLVIWMIKFVCIVISCLLTILYINRYVINYRNLYRYSSKKFHYDISEKDYKVYKIYQSQNYFKYKNSFFNYEGLINNKYEVTSYLIINMYCVEFFKSFNQLNEKDFKLIPFYFTLLNYMDNTEKKLEDINEDDIKLIEMIDI